MDSWQKPIQDVREYPPLVLAGRAFHILLEEYTGNFNKAARLRVWGALIALVFSRQC